MGLTEEDAQLNEAIMASMGKEGQTGHSYEPLNPEQRKREGGTPVGLKNIGNTCYFNSILQVYYNLPEFVRTIFEFKDDDKPLELIEALKDDLEYKQTINRLEQSRKLIANLKKIFGLMTLGDKKYADPTHVLRCITNEDGRVIELGDQQDIGEFNNIFLSRVQEGLNYLKLHERIM
mmetsp:Transcript_17901/g.30439  ORF Transcript_17901/g.30439 Transcript_17901/m.30439 type:complete len:177 (+) Transcript_17901:329-859(+)